MFTSGQVSSNRYNLIKVLSFALPLIVTAMTLGPAPVRAAGGLVVTPTLVEFGPRDRYASLTLVNQGDETQTYRISLVNRRMLPNGQFEPTEEPAAGEGFAAPFIRYAPRQVTLEPRQPQTVRVMLRLPKDLKDGEYRSHILFEQLPRAEEKSATGGDTNGLKINVEARFGMSIPVILRQGELTASASIGDVTPTTLANGKQGLALTINRQGNESVRGDLLVMDGNEEVGLIRNLAIYLSTPERTVNLPLSRPAETARELTVEYRQRQKDGGALIASRTVQLR